MSDPYFSSVVLLAGNENGTDGTNTFIDQSSYARALTAHNAVAWTNVTPPTGMTTSIGSGIVTSDYVTAADAAELRMGNSDFTIECYFRTADGGTHSIVSKGAPSLSDFEFEVITVFSGGIVFYCSSNGTSPNLVNGQQLAASWATDTWYHVEVDRSGNDWYGFINGVQGFTINAAGTMFGGASDVFIGAIEDFGLSSAAYKTGGVRITKGVARHTANFTPPALPLELGASNNADLAWIKA